MTLKSLFRTLTTHRPKIRTEWERKMLVRDGKKRERRQSSKEKIRVWQRRDCREGVGGRKRLWKNVEERWKVERTVRRRDASEEIG